MSTKFPEVHTQLYIFVFKEEALNPECSFFFFNAVSSWFESFLRSKKSAININQLNRDFFFL